MSRPDTMTTAPATGTVARAVAGSKRYGGGDTMVRALDAVDVELEAGCFTAIMGPSGSGKSTLMHCLAGLDTATSGHVYVDGVDLAALNDSRRPPIRLCLDWSERRHHLGGALGAAILARILTLRWARRDPDTRAITFSPTGERELHAWVLCGAGNPAGE